MDPQSWFHDRATSYVAAQLLFHLGRAGVVSALVAGPATTAELAARLDLDADALQAGLEYLAAVDPLLDRDAEGRWVLTDFGRAVVARFGRETAEGPRVNLFDVRVGAYGPVWSGYGALLRREARYGEGVLRAGDEAAEGLYTIGARMGPGLAAVLAGLGVEQVVELGVTAGILEQLSGRGWGLFGLDRSAAALATAEARRAASGADAVTWLEADLFDPAWTGRLDPTRPGVLLSIHFHEVCAAGPERVQALLRSLGARLPGWLVLAAEQPRLGPADRARVPDSLWQYSASNVLIHHLIGNGRVLPDAAWRDLFAGAGLRPVVVTDLQFLGYKAYVHRFPA